MDKREILIIIVALIIVGILIVVMIGKKGDINLNQESDVDIENQLGSETFDPTIPDENLELTKPKVKTQAAPNSSASLRVFEMTAGKDGYHPDQIVVNNGDTVNIKLFASDSDFDFVLPDLGLYGSVEVGQEDKKVGFQALTSGTFTYSCQSLCPGGKNIKGSLIVKK